MTNRLITYILFYFLGLTSSNVVSYDVNLVEIGRGESEGVKIQYVNMNRSGQKVKAKYFAAADYGGNSVYKRYLEWSKGRSIICVTSGTYMDACDNLYGRNNPVGLTIDNGTLVNANYENKFDGLVIVYATGGIAVSNVQNKDLSVDCSGIRRVFDMSNTFHRSQFVDCAKNVNATVFQTHLLVYKNQLKVFSNGSPSKGKRRFLVVGKDDYGDLRHVLLYIKDVETSLYEGSRIALNFTKNNLYMEDIVFMINLDTGCQDVFEAYDANGTRDPKIEGSQPMTQAANLLVYYYE